ncbi:MAG TPA: ABC transporter ATP-binding protein [Patescibacteria group bacterium]|nr:ABC transporter ATP-binding protein [Patescibacteria group bacterium]
MSQVITVSKVSKKYHLGKRESYYALRDVLTDLVHHPFGLLNKASSPVDDFWALRDVSFTVEQGEILGLIGSNGAGKSTLLKILSRITPLTKGEVTIAGRLGSLLEVGTGFHPELTGRENIFLNGAVLGMKRTEVLQSFDEIVEFAGVEQFLDTPMKFYSSGMYTRLAFSVAAHLSADVLLVDEVLAVGDVEFQKKCLGKMGSIARSGKTIIFVSHNMGALQQLCTRGVYLDHGKLSYIGPIDKAIKKYVTENERGGETNVGKRNRSQGLTLHSKMTDIKIIDNNGRKTQTLDADQPFRIQLAIQTTIPTHTGVVFQIRDENSRVVILLSSGDLQNKLFDFSKGKHTIMCDVNPMYLTSGRYSIGCTLGAPNRELVDDVPDSVFFTIKPYDPYAIGFDLSQKYSTVHVNQEWSMT